VQEKSNKKRPNYDKNKAGCYFDPETILRHLHASFDQMCFTLNISNIAIVINKTKNSKAKEPPVS
jgi:hypothetical protein